jgi:hypothetical protein
MGLIKLLTDPSSFKFYANGDPYSKYQGKGYEYGPRERPYGNDLPGGGSSKFPLITTPLPEVDSAPNPKTTPDGLYRGQGVLSKAVLDDTKRISKLLITEEGLQFLAKQQALQFKENLSLYGNRPDLWRYNNPASYIEQTALAATGIHVKNTFSIGSFNQDREPRVSKYGEATTNVTVGDLAANSLAGTDQITTSPMYIAQSAKTGPGYDDTVNMYITKINNDGSGNNTYIHFRSYIKGLSDGYNADWKSSRYMGRGEDFYSYNGFKRDISFNFEVPVLSQREQSSVYSKLNYLASLMAPDYTQGGFMRGNLVKLTVGDYITDVPGILTGIDFKIDESAGWNIGRDEFGNKIDGDYVMPKLIEVGGFKFLPIHDFIPKTVQQSFIETGNGVNNDAPFITYGKKGNASSGGYLFQSVKETNKEYLAKLNKQKEKIQKVKEAAEKAKEASTKG